MDVVISILTNAFDYDIPSAEKKMLEIHEREKGVVHINSKEVCELKNSLVTQIKSKLNDTELRHTVELYEEDKP